MAGWARLGGRPKPVHGGLAAASMPRTLLQPDPPRLRQISAICSRSTPCVDESPSKSNFSNRDRKASTHDVDPSDRGNLSEVGRCRSAGCQPHGCGCQAPMGEGALLAKHCFASARTHSRQRLGRTPEGGVRRPRTPTPPRHPTECSLLTLTLTLTLTLPWLEASAGAGLQALPNTPLLDLHVDHAVADAGLQRVTLLHLVNVPHQGAIIAAGEDAVATGHGRQRADRFQ